MKVKIEGLNSLSKALTKKKVAVENVKTIVSDAADTGERIMKERVPVDTGRLKDSIERKELMEIMNQVFEVSQMIHIDGYELMVSERSSRILLDTSTPTQYLHGVVELEIKYTGG